MPARRATETEEKRILAVVLMLRVRNVGLEDNTDGIDSSEWVSSRNLLVEIVCAEDGRGEEASQATSLFICAGRGFLVALSLGASVPAGRLAMFRQRPATH